MSDMHFPNESKEYRKARDELRKDEQALVDKVKAVAAKRRKLPRGGEVKEDYVFQWANDGKVGDKVKFSELFGDRHSLLLYSFMFGPGWDKPCPSCTSLDGWLRSRLVFGQAECRFCRHRQGAAAKDQRLGERSADGRRFHCSRAMGRPFRPITNARTPTTCSCR